MDRSTIRLLPYADADGPHNMAADETLLESAADGVASLRFYGWSEPTLSLGYFQPERRRFDEGLGELPFVRRPSGGDALLHHHEVTYALALPAGPPCQGPVPWLERMHRIIVGGIRRYAELPDSPESGPTLAQVDQPGGFDGFLCFQHQTKNDVLALGHKIVGSAQRRQRRALLQHGAILWKISPYTPKLPGVADLLTAPSYCLLPIFAEYIESQFIHETGWEYEHGDWTDAERRRIDELVATKYTQDAWNRKR